MKEFGLQILDFFTSTVVLGELELPFTYLIFFRNFLLPVVLLLIGFKLFLFAVRRILKKSRFKEETSQRIYRWTRFLIRISFFAAFLIFFSSLFRRGSVDFFKIFGTFLTQPLIESGTTKISIFTILLTIPIFYLASWAGKNGRTVVRESFLSRIEMDEARKFTIASIVRYLIICLVVLFGFSIIGIDISALTVLFGVLGIGVGFGLQGTVANFFAGLTIIFSRPVKEGDYILVNNVEGTVHNIRLNSTIINTVTNETFIVPNSFIVQNVIHNYSYDDKRIVIVNQVQVSYKADLEKAVAVLAELARRNPYIYEYKQPDVRVLSFDASGITLETRIWLEDLSFKYTAITWTNMEIWRSFRREGIEIPFPQVDVHMKAAENGHEPAR